jgi:hypothetical protein
MARADLERRAEWAGSQPRVETAATFSHGLEVEMTVGRVFSVMSLLAMLTAVAAALASGG